MILIATLGPRATAVLDAARSALRATDADRERVRAALRARLGPSALPLESVVLRASHFRARARRSGWRFVSPVVGMLVLGAALSFAIRPAPSPIVEQKAKPRITEVIGSGAMSARGAENSAPSAEQPPPPVAIASSSVLPVHASINLALPRRKPDQLPLEVALLSRATSALSSGRAGEALKILNEHQRTFPNGLLSTERRAAKGQALCLLGRVAEGRAELAGLASQPLAENRVKLVCDAAEAPADTNSSD